MSAIHFTLDEFDSTVTMDVCATLLQEAPVTIDASATAVLEFSLAAALATFKFASDASDVTNADADDIQYQCNKASFTQINPLHGNVEYSGFGSTVTEVGTPIAEGYAANKASAMHDFVRHIAKHLFNTHQGVDLLSNETALIADLSSNGDDTAWVDISNALGAADGLTNSTTDNTNLVRELIMQLSNSTTGRARLENDISGVSASNYVSVPLKEDDTISFKVTVNAAANQEDLVSAGLAAVPARSYKIVLILKGSPNNTPPDNSA